MMEAESLLDDIIKRHASKEGPLMLILNDVQNTFGCISYDSQRTISERTNISLAEIFGVVTFYSQFQIEPNGKHRIGVCMGTACYVKGAANIQNEVMKMLGIRLGETSEDGLFTLAPTRCLGDCSQSPAMMIDDKVYGHLTVKKAKEIIKAIQKGERP